MVKNQNQKNVPQKDVAAKPAPVKEEVLEQAYTSASEKTNSKECGTLAKNTDPDSVIDYVGELELTEPGDYWLHAHARKNEEGEVYLSLSVDRKKEQSEDLANVDRGVLYKNNRKKLKHHADYTGNINFSTPGKFALSATIEESRNGLTYMSVGVNNDGDSEIEEGDLPF